MQQSQQQQQRRRQLRRGKSPEETPVKKNYAKILKKKKHKKKAQRKLKKGEEKEFCQPEEANEWKASNRGEGEGRFAAQISGKRKKGKKNNIERVNSDWNLQMPTFESRWVRPKNFQSFPPFFHSILFSFFSS